MKPHDRSASAETASSGSSAAIASAGDNRFYSTRWAIVLALALIAIAAIAVYCDSFSGTFVFDDASWIENNTAIRHLWPIWQVFQPPESDVEHTGGRPVVTLTLAINYALGGLNVWGYHAMNLAIHILAAWTLFGVLRRTLTRPGLQEQFGSAATPLALAAALLWTVHPLQTESVTYVIQRAETLVGLFYLLTLYCVIRGADASRGAPWYVAATAACLLGMATKEVMATAPLMVLLYDRTFLAGSFREALRRRWALYLALAATWGVVIGLLSLTGFYGNTTGFAVEKFTWWTYLLTQPGVIVHYLRLAFWPSGQCFDYGWRAPESVVEVILPGLVVVGLLALTCWALVRRPAWGFLGAWFFVVLAPTSSFVPIRDAAFEHRMYLPLAAVVAGSVIGLWFFGRRRLNRGEISAQMFQSVGVILTIFACLALGAVAFRRNLVYESKVSLWGDAAAKAPDNIRAHYNLGLALAACDRTEEAIAEFEKTLKIAPNHADTHTGLGIALAKCRRFDEAVEQYCQALGIAPDLAVAHYQLAVALVALNRLKPAIHEYQEAIKLKPDSAETHTDLASALLQDGQQDDAFMHYGKALEIDSNNAHAHFGIGLAFAQRRQFDEALDHFRKAVEIKPDYAEAYNNLGNTLGSLGHLGEAVEAFQQAVKIKPDYAEAYNNLGISLAARGQFGEAIVQFRKALKIKPDYPAAQGNLRAAISRQGGPNPMMPERP